MDDLVKFINEVPLVSTFDLFEKMGYKEHRMLKKVVIDHIDAFNDLGFRQLELTKVIANTGGRPVKTFLLNEDHFILLVILAKNTPESVQLKIRVSKEFKRLRAVVAALVAQRDNPGWQNVRADGKIAYKQKTDVIKQFVEYVEASGSKSSTRYFGNLARMENAALFIIDQKYKNLREILTIKQLMQAATADDVIEKALLEGMEKEMDYHDIFQLAKERVISFAEIIGKSPVQNLLIEG